jgi:hypothetical protein
MASGVTLILGGAKEGFALRWLGQATGGPALLVRVTVRRG